MKKAKLYKIIYFDGDEEKFTTVEPADFWRFSYKNVERQSSKEIAEIDFEAIRNSCHMESRVIDRIQSIVNSPEGIKRLQRQFDAVLKHLCEYSPSVKSTKNSVNKPTTESPKDQAARKYIADAEDIRRKQAEDDYHKLSSLFRIKLEHREQYAFRLFTLSNRPVESSYYQLPFDGDNTAYSMAAYNNLCCIVGLIDISHWGYIPFRFESIMGFLFHLMSPFYINDSDENDSSNDANKYAAVLHLKDNEQHQQDEQLVYDILVRHWKRPTLFQYTSSYNDFLTQFKKFIDDYHHNSIEHKGLVLEQIYTLKELYNCMEGPRELSPALSELLSPIKTLLDDTQKKPEALIVVDTLFYHCFREKLENLYRRFFAFMMWIKENEDLLPKWAEALAKDADVASINQSYFYAELENKFNRYANDFPNYSTFAGNIPDRPIHLESMNRRYNNYFPHIHHNIWS